MKKLFLILLTTLLPMLASAYDIEVKNADGKTIYYNWINDNTELEITYRFSPYEDYSGSIVIPDLVKYNGQNYSVTSIGKEAFNGCFGLTSVTIPNSVTSIGDYAFRACSGLTSVTIPNSVTSIGNCAFAACYGLTSITVEEGNSIYDSRDNCNAVIEKSKNILIFGCQNTIIPNSVTSIGEWAFCDCSGLTSVTIPNSVKSIGSYAFVGCSGLTSITIPNSVTSIGEGSFSSCSGLTSITISNSVTSIRKWTFQSCLSLTSITIPNSVTSIGEEAFYKCSALTSFTIPNSVTSIGNYAFEGCTGLTSLTIGNSVTSINIGIFAGCSGLTSITIGNSVKKIGGWAFSGCSGLTSITIPNCVTSIGESAFSQCFGLTSITIGNSVKTIGSCAFSGCSNLIDVTCYRETVPNTKSDAFQDSYIESATLHVPSASVDAYNAKEPWNNFKSIVAIDDETPTTQKCEKPTISYINGKLTYNCATEGAEYVTSISDTDIKTHYGNEISLTATYNISVYATKAGYDNSDVATATLCWIDKEPQTEGITDGIAQIAARPVLIKTDNGFITVEGVDERTNVSIYTTDGKQVGSAISQNSTATIATSIQPSSIAIVKVGEKSVKVIIH